MESEEIKKEPTNGNQLKDFTIQLTLPAPNAEIAKEVANKAQSLIDQFGYYQFLNLVDFMQRNPGAVSFGFLIFSKLQKGDTIYTLERDRRSGYPIFDTAKVLKVGESKPRATGPDGSFTANTEISIQDSVSAVTIYLPTDAAEGIYNNVYYTTDLRNIVNEVNIQRTTAVNILNNREKYEAVVTECDNIYHTIEGMLTPQQQPAQAYKQEEFEAFKSEVAEKLSMQQDILMKIASELGLNKNKDGKQKG